MRVSKNVATVSVDVTMTLLLDIEVPDIGDDGWDLVGQMTDGEWRLTESGNDYVLNEAEDRALQYLDSVEGYDGMATPTSLLVENFSRQYVN